MGAKNINVAVGGHQSGDYPKVYNTVYIKPNIPFALQVTEPNTKYVVRHKIDLGGKGDTVSDVDFTNAGTHEIAGVEYYYVPFTANGKPYTLLDDSCVFITSDWTGLSERTITPDEGTVFMIASMTGGLHTGAYINAEVVTMPENCILEFDGGSLDNGVIVGQDTVFINVGDVEIWGKNLIRLGTWKEHSGGGINDREYDPEHYSGYGRKTLQLKGGGNILTQDDFDHDQTVYAIPYDFDLDGQEINVPASCVLEFDGGSIKNGKMILNDTVINSEDKCFENVKFAEWDDADGAEYFVYHSTIGNDSVHLRWFGDNLSMDDLQQFFDFALGAKKDADLDGLTITVDKLISLNNLLYHHDWWWWTIKNGTIIGDAEKTDTIFTANEKDTLSYPRYGCIVFENIAFVNSSTVANLPENTDYSYYNIYSDWMANYDYTQPDNRVSDDNRDYQPLANKICLLSGNRICRTFVNNCSFNGVSLVETGAYLESIYITGCRLQNLEYSFILCKNRGYDIHFTNNTVEFSLESVIMDIYGPESLEISGNLIQYVRAALVYSYGDGVTVTNNYFEGCREHIVKKEWYQGTTNGFTFTGNTCFQLQYDIVSDGGVGEYHYLHMDGTCKGYNIFGNSFYVQSFEDASVKPRPAYTVKPVKFVRWAKSYGIFLASRDDESVDTGYNGCRDIKTVVKKITGDPEGDTLGEGLSGTIVPVGGKSSDMGVDGNYDYRIPSPGNTHRIYMNKECVGYDFEKDDETLRLDDYLWKATMMDAAAPYIPWTYVKRHLAEDEFAVENGELDPSIPTDAAIRYTPWIKQCMMLDRVAGSDYLDANLGKPGSRMDFTKAGNYYDGLMRFDPSTGFQWWKTDHWCDAIGFNVRLKKYGSKSVRPFAVTKITTLPEVGGLIAGATNVWENDNPSRYYSTLIDVSAYKDRLLQVDCAENGYLAFLKSEPVEGQEVEYASGSSLVRFNTSSKFLVPSDAKYLYVNLRSGDVIYPVNSVAIVEDFIPYDYMSGFTFFDTDINKPTWFSGDVYVGDDGWVDANGEDPYQE